MKTVSKEEEKLIEISEQKNPYAKECPNRHLWSEGFRSGYRTAYEKTSNMEELVKAQKEYIHITDNQLWLAKPSKYYDKYCQLRKRITELNNNLK